MNSNDWRETTIGAEVDLLTGNPFDSSEYTDNMSDIRLLRGDNVIQGQIRWDGVKLWNKSNVKGLKEYFLNVGDVVLAMDRPWIEAGLKYAAISEYDLPCLLVQRVSRLRGKDNLDQRFLKYVIGSKDFTDYILGVQTGTSVPHISSGQIKGYKFLCPPLPEQRAIARILGALDDKIELNRRMNHTLEEMARALFKSWFVDFDPVTAKAEGRVPYGMNAEMASLFPAEFVETEEGLIPKGWKVGTVGEMVTVVGGTTPSTGKEEFWTGGTIAWATPKDLSGLPHPVLLDTDRKITPEGLEQISSGLLPAGTLLMSSRAPVGYLAISEIPVAINQGFIAMHCEKGFSNYYVIQWIRENMENIISHANGTTFLEISKSSFRLISAILPSEPILEKFSETAGKLHSRIVANVKENQALATIRDALLPKLMSGEVRVNSGME